jgi:hypothetical protein
MKAGWIMLATVVTLAAGGCAPDPDQQHPVSGEPVPAEPGPMRPPEAHMEGQYVLISIDGAPPPVVIGQAGPCHTEIVDASLVVEAGRFAFQNRVREVCDGVAQADLIAHAAGGSVAIDGTRVVLESELGQAFSRADGVADEAGITLQQLATDAGQVAVSWRFERHGPQSVPLPGTTGPGTTF